MQTTNTTGTTELKTVNIDTDFVIPQPARVLNENGIIEDNNLKIEQDKTSSYRTMLEIAKKRRELRKNSKTSKKGNAVKMIDISDKISIELKNDEVFFLCDSCEVSETIKTQRSFDFEKTELISVNYDIITLRQNKELSLINGTIDTETSLKKSKIKAINKRIKEDKDFSLKFETALNSVTKLNKSFFIRFTIEYK